MTKNEKKKRQNYLLTMLEFFTLYHEFKQLVVCGGEAQTLHSLSGNTGPLNAFALFIMDQNSPGLSLGICEQPMICIILLEGVFCSWYPIC